MREQHGRLGGRRMAGDESGFTLVELLIVIVVLGILAGVTVFALSGTTAQSAASSCKADAKSVEVAAEAYRAQTGSYPPSIAALVPAYLRTLPASSHYAITMVANTGEVDVAITGPPAVAATNFDTNGGAVCNQAT